MKEFFKKYAAAFVVGSLVLTIAIFVHLYLVEKAINDEIMQSRQTHQFLLQLNAGMTPQVRQAFIQLGYPLPTPKSALASSVPIKPDTTKGAK